VHWDIPELVLNPSAEPQLMTVETAEVCSTQYERIVIQSPDTDVAVPCATVQLHQCPVIGSQSFYDHMLHAVHLTAVECFLMV